MVLLKDVAGKDDVFITNKQAPRLLLFIMCVFLVHVNYDADLQQGHKSKYKDSDRIY